MIGDDVFTLALSKHLSHPAKPVRSPTHSPPLSHTVGLTSGGRQEADGRSSGRRGSAVHGSGSPCGRLAAQGRAACPAGGTRLLGREVVVTVDGWSTGKSRQPWNRLVHRMG